MSAHHRARQTASGRCTELGGHRELAPRSVAGVNPGDHRTDLDVSCRCTLNTRRHRGCRGRHTHAAAAGRARPDGHGTVRPLPTRCSRGRSPAGDAAVPPPSAAQGPRNTRGYRTRAVPTGAADAEVVPAEGIRRGLWAGCACGMADASVRVTRTEIHAIAKRIGAEFRPEKVILFGSHAYGTPSEDSDVDLLVIMEHSGSGGAQALEVVRRVRSRIPVDLVVRTPQEDAPAPQVERLFPHGGREARGSAL